jgi:hypothetical protein
MSLTSVQSFKFDGIPEFPFNLDKTVARAVHVYSANTLMMALTGPA